MPDIRPGARNDGRAECGQKSHVLVVYLYHVNRKHFGSKKALVGSKLHWAPAWCGKVEASRPPKIGERPLSLGHEGRLRQRFGDMSSQGEGRTISQVDDSPVQIFMSAVRRVCRHPHADASAGHVTQHIDLDFEACKHGFDSRRIRADGLMIVDTVSAKFRQRIYRRPTGSRISHSRNTPTPGIFDCTSVSLRTAQVRYTKCGSAGTASSRMPHSAKSRLPLRVLQEEHAVTTLAQAFDPPRESGTRWSRVKHSR